MKSTKDFRGAGSRPDSEDLRRGTKLSPVKKSGKERYSIYSKEEDDDDEIFLSSSKKESVFDYFDDVEEDN